MKKIIIIILTLFLTGCYNHTSLNNIALVSLLTIDYQDKYIITIEVRENEKENPNTSSFYTATGFSLETTIQKLNQSLNKTIYLVDIETMILTTNLLKTKLPATLDYLTRQNNIGNNFNILVTEENIEDIISIIKNKNKIVGTYLKETITNKQNNNIEIIYNQLLKTYLNEYKDIILPYLTIENNETYINKAIILKNNKTKILNNQEINIYNILNNNNKQQLIETQINNNYVIYRIKSLKTKITYKNNKININIDLIGNFNEIDNIPLNEENIKMLTNKTKETLETETSNLLNHLINNNLDILGFKKIIYNQTRNKINNINNLEYEINTNIQIEREELTFNKIGEQNEI